MIKVTKDFTDVPSILTKETRKEVFNNNITASSYIDKDNRYKVGSVQKKLNEIYHLKCAYCEKTLLDAPKHIEHYRPKDIYYWLAYSWDNLLLSCGNCNSAKGNRFETTNTKVIYTNEPFTSIHNLTVSYDEIEIPLIINPEQEDVLSLISYDKDSKISSNDSRVQHTIESACNLNREELVQQRKKVITDFINRMNEHFIYFKKEGGASRFLPDIKIFKDACILDSEFYSYRYFIINNIEIFFDENPPLQKLMKALLV